jgi:hypothetical protein
MGSVAVVLLTAERYATVLVLLPAESGHINTTEAYGNQLQT